MGLHLKGWARPLDKPPQFFGKQRSGSVEADLAGEVFRLEAQVGVEGRTEEQAAALLEEEMEGLVEVEEASGEVQEVGLYLQEVHHRDRLQGTMEAVVDMDQGRFCNENIVMVGIEGSSEI